MTTRAKLVCTSIKPQYNNEGTDQQEKSGEQVGFHTQYKTEDKTEDNNYSLYTPSANANLHITNPELFGTFEKGKACYFDITACPEAEPATAEPAATTEADGKSEA